MKRFLSKTSALVAAVALISSCSSDNNDSTPEVKPGVEEYTLQGVLTTEKTLKAHKTYTLSGGYEVEKGGKLIIEEGVTVLSDGLDDDVDYILIKQGAQILAKGTQENPIIMTSTKEEAGAWGGLHICGYAPINTNISSSKSEIGDASYGGTNANDNSGILKYIRLEYTGYAFSEVKESNGVTFYGVGDGTQVEYLQVYKGADDGFEWFGGTVNAKYLVSSESQDDSFDWTDGWKGNGQFWVAFQNQTGEEGDCLIEADNRDLNLEVTPVSHPTIANLTLVGNNSTQFGNGVRFRKGTFVNIYNAIVTGKEKSIVIESDPTAHSFLEGVSVAKNVLSTKGFTNKTDMDLSSVLNKNGNATVDKFDLTNNFIGTVPNTETVVIDHPFFEVTNYAGAVSPENDWTKGWVRTN